MGKYLPNCYEITQILRFKRNSFMRIYLELAGATWQRQPMNWFSD